MSANREVVKPAAAKILLPLVLVTVSAMAQSPATSHSALPDQIAMKGPDAKKAEEQFKNIQVLKGIPAEQVVPTMQFVAASLGVDCEFCHVRNAFEKDDKKPKQTARKMMDMMFAINKDSFAGSRAVTCNSCHRGSPIPQPIPLVMSEASKESIPMPKSAEVKETAAPAPESLLEKYVQAAGGAVAIEKVTSRVMKGTIDFGGQSLPIEIYAKEPDKRISFTHMPGGDSIMAFDGHNGWLGTPGRPAHEMHGSELDAAAMDADLHLPLHLKPMFSAMRAEGTEKIGDRQANVVVGERTGKTPVRLYFDEESGLLLRMVRFGDTALGWLPTQIDYADYRDTDGVKVAYRWTLSRPSGRFTIQVSEMVQNVPLDDDKFAKLPAAQIPENKR
jgi:photosynthetic reaction center cytochrome c subunit